MGLSVSVAPCTVECPLKWINDSLFPPLSTLQCGISLIHRNTVLMTVGTLFYNLHFKSSFLTQENIKFLKVFMKKKSFLLQSATQHPFFWDNSYLKLVNLFFIIEVGVDSYCSPSDQHTQTTCCTTKNSHFHFPLPNLLFLKKKKRDKKKSGKTSIFCLSDTNHSPATCWHPGGGPRSVSGSMLGCPKPAGWWLSPSAQRETSS